MPGQVLWKLLQTPGAADLSRKEAHPARSIPGGCAVRPGSCSLWGRYERARVSTSLAGTPRGRWALASPCGLAGPGC